MRSKKLFSVIIIALFFLFSCSSNSITVLKVIDGDTIIISTGESVRYIGINAPEEWMFFYNEAKRENEELVLGKKVELVFDKEKRDRYGRLLAYVFVGRIFVNHELLRKGVALIYRDRKNRKYRSLLIEAEEEARENRKGLWRDFHKVPVRFKRINYDAEGRDDENLNGEYAILKNLTDKKILISNFAIKDESHNMFVFPENSYIEGNGEVIVYTGSGKNKDGRFYWDHKTPVWNNDHDTGYLMDEEGYVVDFYRY